MKKELNILFDIYDTFDPKFIKKYILLMYNKRMEDFFGVTKQSCSNWIRKGKMPNKRLNQFYKSENTVDERELIKKCLDRLKNIR